MSREDSILRDIKHRVGPSGDYEYYDVDIIDAINTAFATLTQLGAGPSEGFTIYGEDETWNDFTTDQTVQNLTRTYIYMAVRLIFDQPTSYVLTEMKDKMNEYEQRISYWVDDQSGKEPV